MLQRGVDVTALEPGYVSSLCWYMFVMMSSHSLIGLVQSFFTKSEVEAEDPMMAMRPTGKSVVFLRKRVVRRRGIAVRISTNKKNKNSHGCIICLIDIRYLYNIHEFRILMLACRGWVVSAERP